MGHRLIKHLESTEYNRKLFYLTGARLTSLRLPTLHLLLLVQKLALSPLVRSGF